jgi:hypothetical protein
MMRACAAVLAFTALLSQAARADVHCYTFRNDAAGVTSLGFAYSPVTGGVVTGVAIDSGKTYPFDGRPWCWNLPAGSSATVTVSGAGVPGWTGKLVLGNGAQTADSGTYVLTGAARAGAPPAVAASAAVAAATAGAGSAGSAPPAGAAAAAPAADGQAQSCLPNAFPNGNRYCLTASREVAAGQPRHHRVLRDPLGRPFPRRPGSPDGHLPALDRLAATIPLESRP